MHGGKYPKDKEGHAAALIDSSAENKENDDESISEENYGVADSSCDGGTGEGDAKQQQAVGRSYQESCSCGGGSGSGKSTVREITPIHKVIAVDDDDQEHEALALPHSANEDTSYGEEREHGCMHYLPSCFSSSPSTSTAAMAAGSASSMPPYNVEALGKKLLELVIGETDNGAKAKELVDSGANLNTLDESWNTAIMWAVAKCHADIFDKLIAAKADVNHQNKHGFTALIRAAGKGHDSIVGELIDAGAEVNHRNKNGDTALMRASKNGHKKTAVKLITADQDLRQGRV